MQIDLPIRASSSDLKSNENGNQLEILELNMVKLESPQSNN